MLGIHNHFNFGPYRRMILAGICVLVSLATLEAESYYQLGKRAYSQKKYELALEHFEKSAQSIPTNGNPYYYIGRIYSDLNKNTQSMLYFGKAVHLKTAKDLKEEALWKLVSYHKFKRNWNKLYEFSSMLLKIDPSNSRALKYQKLAKDNRGGESYIDKNLAMQEAALLAKAGKYKEAIAAFDKILAFDRQYHPARWKKALLLMKLDKYSEANSEFKKLIQNDNADWEYHYKSAICHFKLHEYNESLAQIDSAETKNKDKSQTFIYYINYLKARIYLNSNDYKQSCSAFQQAYKSTNKHSSSMLSYYALANLECGNAQEADRAANLVLKKEPGSLFAKLVKIRLKIDQKKSANEEAIYKESKQLFGSLGADDLKSLHSGYTPVLIYLGKLSVLKKDYEIAKKAYEAVSVQRLTADAKHEREKNSKEDPLWDYNYHFGLALLYTNEIDRAIMLFDKLQKNEISWYLLSKANARKGNTTLSKRYLLKSTDLNPERWVIARQDADFTNLMKSDLEFKQFILSRNQPVEKEKVGP